MKEAVIFGRILNDSLAKILYEAKQLGDARRIWVSKAWYVRATKYVSRFCLAKTESEGTVADYEAEQLVGGYRPAVLCNIIAEHGIIRTVRRGPKQHGGRLIDQLCGDIG